MKQSRLCAMLLCCLLLSITIFAHPGRTDANGGHWNRKEGTYHFHTGEYAGRNSSSSSAKSESDTFTPPYEPLERQEPENKEAVFYDIFIVIVLYILPFSILIIPLIFVLFEKIYYYFLNKRH